MGYAAALILGFLSLPLVHASDTLKAITIPLFTGAIGYVINWTGVWMLFHPVRFVGFRMPGLAAVEAVHARVQEQLPDIVRAVTDEIGENIDQLLDVKLMVIRHLEANPALVNRIFLDVGQRELRLMIDFGFLFGFLFGIPVVAITML